MLKDCTGKLYRYIRQPRIITVINVHVLNDGSPRLLTNLGHWDSRVCSCRSVAKGMASAFRGIAMQRVVRRGMTATAGAIRPTSGVAAPFIPCDPGCMHNGKLLARCKYCAPADSKIEISASPTPAQSGTAGHAKDATGPAFTVCDPGCGDGYKLCRCKHCRPTA